MPFLPEDEHFLRRALALARDAAAFASPNPAVGCVLTRDGQSLSEGAHYFDRRDHAEIAALKQAESLGSSVHGATAYVTLEPCAHHGRTGPCAVALVAAQIARCVIATVDPNPQVSGQGIAILRTAGIKVDVADANSALARESRRLNDAFAFAIQHSRPFVTLKAAVSCDGYLAPQPHIRNAKGPYWLTGPSARADVQTLRHASDAIVTGIGTALADNPSLTDRTVRPRRRRLLRVVLDSNLRIPIRSALLSRIDHDLLIATSLESSLETENLLRASGADIVRLPTKFNKGIDLNALLQVLQERQIRSLLLEAGSALNASFLASSLVDKVVLYQSAIELGPSAIPFAANQITAAELESHLSERSTVNFTRTDAAEGTDVRVSGYLHDPWQNVSSEIHC